MIASVQRGGNEEDERRQDRRQRITLQVEYPDRQGYRVDWIESASPGGLFLRTDTRHRVGDSLRLSLTLPGFPRTIDVLGEVAWLRHESPDEGAGVGVRIAEQAFFDQIAEYLPLAASREFSLTTGPYARLAWLPRVRLAATPTPLHRAERLSRALGGPDIWIKRDDLTGFGLGGDVVRKLELIAADALESGADTLVAAAPCVRSSHLRTTMAVARHLGLHPAAVVPTASRESARGDLLLDEILGTEYVESSGGDPEQQLDAALPALERLGRTPYAVDLGAAPALGSCGFVLAAIELQAQARRMSLEPDVVVLAHESASTQAGLVVGQRWLDTSCEVLGIIVLGSRTECAQRVALLAGEVASLLKIDDTIPVDDLWVEDDHAGPADRASPEAMEAIRLVARTEGICLDPIYTGRAMAALIDLVRRGEIQKDQTVVFWHTGGWPAL